MGEPGDVQAWEDVPWVERIPEEVILRSSLLDVLSTAEEVRDSATTLIDTN
jgi:hypothetical protein